jgi:hypothetical protein
MCIVFGRDGVKSDVAYKPFQPRRDGRPRCYNIALISAEHLYNGKPFDFSLFRKQFPLEALLGPVIRCSARLLHFRSVPGHSIRP